MCAFEYVGNAVILGCIVVDGQRGRDTNTGARLTFSQYTLGVPGGGGGVGQGPTPPLGGVGAEPTNTPKHVWQGDIRWGGASPPTFPARSPIQ